MTGLVTTAGGEEGLLAFAAAPDYATSGRVFAYYMNKSSDLQLDEYRRTGEGPDRSDAGTRRPLLTIQHDAAQNHNGGQLLFGRDGGSTCRPATAGPRATPRATRRAWPRCSARSSGATAAIPQTPGDATAPRLRTLVKRPPARAAPARRDRLRALQRDLRRRRRRAACASASRLYKLRRATKLARANKRTG